MSWLLVAAVAIPLALQARALRGRSYAILSGRTRQAARRRLSLSEAVCAGSLLALFFLVMLGIPGFGAVSGSLLGDYGGSFSLTLVNYQALFQQSGLLGPLERSLVYGVIAASVTVFLGFIAARLLSSARRTRATGAMDYVLLASVALPGVVFGAGYIFAYNLPIMSTLHIDLYQTVQLLVIAYIASSLPTNARVLVGSVSQIQGSLRDAARAHGAGPAGAWARGVLPVVSRPIMMAWLYTFCGVFLELPLSQLLYAPGSPPASISIEDNLGNYHFGVGMAQAVLAVFIAFLVVGVVLGGYRLLAPAGWRRIGGTVGGWDRRLAAGWP
jgi:iron(III) transport system permease protein